MKWKLLFSVVFANAIWAQTPEPEYMVNPTFSTPMVQFMVIKSNMSTMAAYDTMKLLMDAGACTFRYKTSPVIQQYYSQPVSIGRANALDWLEPVGVDQTRDLVQSYGIYVAMEPLSSESYGRDLLRICFTQNNELWKYQWGQSSKEWKVMPDRDYLFPVAGTFASGSIGSTQAHWIAYKNTQIIGEQMVFQYAGSYGKTDSIRHADQLVTQFIDQALKDITEKVPEKLSNDSYDSDLFHNSTIEKLTSGRYDYPEASTQVSAPQFGILNVKHIKSLINQYNSLTQFKTDDVDPLVLRLKRFAQLKYFLIQACIANSDDQTLPVPETLQEYTDHNPYVKLECGSENSQSHLPTIQSITFRETAKDAWWKVWKHL